MGWSACAALAALLWLNACTSTGDGSHAPFSRPAAHAHFEQQQLKEARRRAAQGDLAGAAFHWEVLRVLRPDVDDYADELARTQRDIQHQVHTLLRVARQAQQKGALDEAQQHYLAVLALRPDERSAAKGLRAIEHARVQREQLGRYSARQFWAPRPVPRPPLTSKP